MYLMLFFEKYNYLNGYLILLSQRNVLVRNTHMQVFNIDNEII